MSDVIQFPSHDALLDISVVNEMLKDLSEAFPGGSRSKDVANLLRVYRTNLAGVSESAARGAVRSIIRNDERFPSVSRVRAAAHEWTRRNVGSPEYQLRHDANRCQSCGHPFVHDERWRPAVDVAGRVELTHDKQAIYLERYHRDACGCHAPCNYVPDISAEAEARYGARATMPIALLPVHTQHRIVDQFANVRASWRRAPDTTPLADAVQQIAAGGAV